MTIDPSDLVDRLRADLEAWRSWAAHVLLELGDAHDGDESARVCLEHAVCRLLTDLARVTRERDAAQALVVGFRAAAERFELMATQLVDIDVERTRERDAAWSLLDERKTVIDDLNADVATLTREHDEVCAATVAVAHQRDAALRELATMRTLMLAATESCGAARGQLLALVDGLQLDDAPRRAAIETARAALRGWGMTSALDAREAAR